MSWVAATIPATLLSAAAVALAVFDHPRLGVAALGAAGVLLAQAVASRLRRTRP